MRYFPVYDHAECVATTRDDGFKHFCPPDQAVDLLAIAGYAFLALVLWFFIQDMRAFRRESKQRERLRRLTGDQGS